MVWPGNVFFITLIRICFLPTPFSPSSKIYQVFSRDMIMWMKSVFWWDMRIPMLVKKDTFVLKRSPGGVSCGYFYVNRPRYNGIVLLWHTIGAATPCKKTKHIASTKIYKLCLINMVTILFCLALFWCYWWIRVIYQPVSFRAASFVLEKS